VKQAGFDFSEPVEPTLPAPAVSPLRRYRANLVEQIIRDCRVMEEIEEGYFGKEFDPVFFEGRIASYSEEVALVDKRIAAEEPSANPKA
jgi:hypothetical protein